MRGRIACRARVASIDCVRACLSVGRERLGHDFHAGKVFDSLRLELAQHVTQKWTIAAANLLELNAHPEIVDEIFHLRLESEADVIQVEQEAEISSGPQRVGRVDARAEFRNLFDLSGYALHAIDHLRLSFGIEARTAAAVRIRTLKPPPASRCWGRRE